MWILNLLNFSYTLAAAASDGEVTKQEILEALQEIFPDRVDVVLEQIQEELDRGESFGVDDVVKIVASFVR